MYIENESCTNENVLYLRKFNNNKLKTDIHDTLITIDGYPIHYNFTNMVCVMNTVKIYIYIYVIFLLYLFPTTLISNNIKTFIVKFK